MASDESLATFVCDQASQWSPVSSRKMFGEYALYCRGKVVGFICRNQLYVKPTSAGRALIDDIVEGAPYPGAKPYLMIAERLDDREWLSGLIEATAGELPEPAPKKAAAPRKPTRAAKPDPEKKATKAAKATEATEGARAETPDKPGKAGKAGKAKQAS
jgi:DNA transformation protein